LGAAGLPLRAWAFFARRGAAARLFAFDLVARLVALRPLPGLLRLAAALVGVGVLPGRTFAGTLRALAAALAAAAREIARLVALRIALAVALAARVAFLVGVRPAALVGLLLLVLLLVLALGRSDGIFVSARFPGTALAAVLSFGVSARHVLVRILGIGVLFIVRLAFAFGLAGGFAVLGFLVALGFFLRRLVADPGRFALALLALFAGLHRLILAVGGGPFLLRRLVFRVRLAPFSAAFGRFLLLRRLFALAFFAAALSGAGLLIVRVRLVLALRILAGGVLAVFRLLFGASRLALFGVVGFLAGLLLAALLLAVVARALRIILRHLLAGLLLFAGLLLASFLARLIAAGLLFVRALFAFSLLIFSWLAGLLLARRRPFVLRPVALGAFAVGHRTVLPAFLAGLLPRILLAFSGLLRFLLRAFFLRTILVRTALARLLLGSAFTGRFFILLLSGRRLLVLFSRRSFAAGRVLFRRVRRFAVGLLFAGVVLRRLILLLVVEEFVD